MEIAIAMPKVPGKGRFSLVLLTVALAGLVLLGVALGIRAAMIKEVPLKPCATCPNCPCPVGLNGPRCGCPH